MLYFAFSYLIIDRQYFYCFYIAFLVFNSLIDSNSLAKLAYTGYLLDCFANNNKFIDWACTNPSLQIWNATIPSTLSKTSAASAE